jgi:hypothetical protein
MKNVFTLAEKLPRQGHTIELDNYYSNLQVFDMLNELETDAVGIVRSNRKGLLTGKNLMK